jgi:hypothetical protein
MMSWRFGFPRRFGVANDPVQLMQCFRLFIDEQLGIADNVHEEDMSDLQPQFDFLLARHLRLELRRLA